MLNMALKLFVASSITRAVYAQTCDADLATFESAGVRDPPVVSLAETPELCMYDDGVDICDFFTSENPDSNPDEYEGRCNDVGGNTVTIATNSNCPDFFLITKNIVPLCLPPSCNVTEQIAELEGKAQNSFCDVTVQLVDTCPSDLGSLKADGLDAPELSSFGTPDMCVTDGAGYDICNYFAHQNELDKYTSDCTSEGGNVVPIVKDTDCADFGKTQIITPWCVPQSCDINEQIQLREAEEISKQFPGCETTVQMYDMTDKPTSPPTKTPTSTPTTSDTCPSDIQKLNSVDGLSSTFPNANIDCAVDESTTSDGVTTTITDCDFYSTIDTEAVMEKCSANQGTLISATMDQICDFGSTVIKLHIDAPFCIPNSCVASEVLASEEDAAFTGCARTVTSDNICGADIARLKTMELAAEFPLAFGDQCTADYGSTPIMTDCDFYNVEGLDDVINSCTAAEGNLVSARQDSICRDESDQIGAIITSLVPMCIPNSCDPNVFLAQKEAELESACENTVTSPDVTGTPSSTPTSSPSNVSSSSPTDFPTSTPTSSPTAVPTSSPTGSPSSSPSAIPTRASTTKSPTGTPTTSPPTGTPTTPLTSPPTTTPLCKNKVHYDPLCKDQRAKHESAFTRGEFDVVDFSSDICEVINGTDTCDMYKSADITKILDTCERTGGDIIQVTAREICASANTDRSLIYPLCVPRSCDTQDFIDFHVDTLRKGNAPGGCTTDVDINNTIPFSVNSRVGFCEKEECVDISVGDFNSCLRKQGEFDRGGFFYDSPEGETCAFGVPIVEEGTSLTCNKYKDVRGVLERIDLCTAAGGDMVNITETRVCAYKSRRTTTVYIAPMCVPRVCDPYQSIPNHGRKIKSNLDPECTVTMSADIHKTVDYCGYVEPVRPAVTLTSSCESDLMRWETSTGLMANLDDGAGKVCQSTPIDGVFTTTCNYKEGEREKVVEMCNNMTGFMTSNSTSVTNCTVYGEARSRVVSNTLCLPESCDKDKLIQLLEHEQELTEDFGCKVSSLSSFRGRDADEDGDIVKNQDSSSRDVDVSEESESESDDTKPEPSGAVSFNIYKNFALLVMGVLIFGA